MAEAIFLIPEKDSDRIQALRGVAGIQAVQATHKPFDPFSADAETQAVAEAVVTVSYDPAQMSIAQIRDALRSCNIHILDVQRGE